MTEPNTQEPGNERDHLIGQIQELEQQIKELEKESARLTYRQMVNDKIDMWPTWKIRAIDSFTLKKGSLLDRLIIAEKQLTANKATMAAVEENMKYIVTASTLGFAKENAKETTNLIAKQKEAE